MRSLSMKTLRTTAISSAALIVLGACTASSVPQGNAGEPSVQQAAALTDQQISDAYLYLLGRVLVLRQQRLDFEREGFQWNHLVYREPGGVTWANPNLDVAYSEAWVAVDEKTCVRLDMPKVSGRYYTWQMLNGWGETAVNINERTYPTHPDGSYAFCLKGAAVSVPAGLQRIDLPGKTFRVLARIELGADPAAAARLQRQFTLTPLGQPKTDPPTEVPVFTNKSLPGAEVFDWTDAILRGEPDINPGMAPIRAQVASVAALARSGAEGRARVERTVREQAWQALQAQIRDFGTIRNGWVRPSIVGNYGDDYKTRTAVNLVGIWANNSAEVTYFGNRGLDGGQAYSQTFPAAALPSKHARYFWSVIAVDAQDFKVIPNPISRFLLNKESALKYNADGSLTIVYAPTLPSGTPRSNWLPTPAGSRYNLTFRYYGPDAEVANGNAYPPALVRID
ncbi:DUF1214 domain-containing protein [Cupriavidus pinatubonensis]|nr:DUF1214 domain-containing protein [Cupriavidus pinatubonensis]